MLIYLIEQIQITITTSFAYLYDKINKLIKKQKNTYAGLSNNLLVEKEVVGLINKAAKFKIRFDQRHDLDCYSNLDQK